MSENLGTDWRVKSAEQHLVSYISDLVLYGASTKHILGVVYAGLSGSLAGAGWLTDVDELDILAKLEEAIA